MSMFKKNNREMPLLNTASLPDLIFTVLFFFLIVTHLRHDEMRVKLDTPDGTKLERLTRKASPLYIYVGYPIDNLGNTKSDGYVIQLNDKIVTIDDIASFVISEREHISEDDAGQMIIDIKADKRVKMGTITDIKQALRSVNALKIRYSAKEKTQNEMQTH